MSQEKLDRLTDALVENILTTPDDQIMAEVEEDVRLAKEELARIDGELRALHEAHHERVAAERARHADRLRDLAERFFYEREPLEKHREAIAKVIVDVECMKTPRIILNTLSQ